MTPHELNIHIEEYRKREVYMQKERIATAYWSVRFDRQKVLPKLEDVFKSFYKEESKPKDEEQEAVDMLAEVKRLNAALGGTEF